MLDRSEIRFLPLGARRLAYELRGGGPPLVAPAWWVSHLELDWQMPNVRQFWERAAVDHTLVRYDRLGVGMSDRAVRDDDLTLDGEVATLRALLDELDVDRVSLIGGSSGSCTAVAFAAAFPERVERLVLYGSYANGADLTTPRVARAVLSAVDAHWGLGSRLLGDVFLSGAAAADVERFARVQREAATAQTAAAVLRMVYGLDVRESCTRVVAPTTVLHRRGDRAVPYALGREVAARIPGAVLVPLAGRSHFPWYGDVNSVARACRRALAADGRAAAGAHTESTTLSGREREILACVARGLGDREIAEQLSLSPHTVHRHVANVRTKLGQSSRAAAVAEAVRLGLL